jgi:biotin carboxylase
MNKALMVLAASTYQIPAIRTAKRMGYRVITTDNAPSNPGHAFADASYDADTTDQERVLDIARKEGISGIIAAGTDVAVVTASYVAEQLHLPGPPLNAARILTHKQYFREFLSTTEFLCPLALPLASDKLPTSELFNGRNWLIKPSRSSGSKGVFVVRSEAEFLSRVAESRAFSMDGTCVLEEFIEGTQHTCEGVLKNGQVQLSLLTDRSTAAFPYTATTGHTVPSRLPLAIQTLALSVIENVLRRLGVSSGPFDCDFVADNDRISIIEITPRLGGNSLSSLFMAALDFDLVAYAVSHACGDTYPLPQPSQPRPAAIAILGVERSGSLSWSETEAAALRRECWVDTILFDQPPGTAVKPFVNGRHRVGEVLITGSNRNEIDFHLIEVRRRLAVVAR